jgi:heme/copper-type cytochrome/quinol oxidase subunit 4
MNLKRFRAQKLAVKYGILLGLLFVALNYVLTFIYLDPQFHTILSYMTVPFIIIVAGLVGFLRMRQTGNLEYAVQSSILTVMISLIIGFGSLFFLTYANLDLVRNNPVILQNFQTSGKNSLDEFIRSNLINAATMSVAVSTVLGIISGIAGAMLSKRK